MKSKTEPEKDKEYVCTTIRLILGLINENDKFKQLFNKYAVTTILKKFNEYLESANNERLIELTAMLNMLNELLKTAPIEHQLIVVILLVPINEYTKNPNILSPKIESLLAAFSSILIQLKHN